jgi:CRISPR locus-related DNA-binding protein
LSRVLVTNSDVVVLVHGRDYDKAVYVVFVIGRRDYSDVVKDHKVLVDVCRGNNINLELEVIQVDELGEKPFVSTLSTLWKHYREHDEIHVYINTTEKLVSTTLLALATLSLPVDGKRVKLVAEDMDFRVELDVNAFAKFTALDEVEKKILWYLTLWGDAKLSEIARALQTSRTTIYKKLKKLERLSLVKTTETYTYRAEKLVDVHAVI